MSATTYQHIQSLLDQLDQDEKLNLIDELAGLVRQSAPPGTRHSDPLFGAMRGQAPEDLDLDSVLGEIRSRP